VELPVAPKAALPKILVLTARLTVLPQPPKARPHRSHQQIVTVPAQVQVYRHMIKMMRAEI
jgi:hypothetical protein